MTRKHLIGRKGLLGAVRYYDEKGRYMGKSTHGILETTRVFYDSKGNRIGTSRPGLLAGSRIYRDEKGRYAGKGRVGILGTTTRRYDKYGKLVSVSRAGLLGNQYITVMEDDAPEEFGFADDSYWDDELFDDDFSYEDEEYEEYADLDENINGDDSEVLWENKENVPEEVTRNVVVRNIVAFGACVLLCAVIFLVVALR